MARTLPCHECNGLKAFCLVCRGYSIEYEGCSKYGYDTIVDSTMFTDASVNMTGLVDTKMISTKWFNLSSIMHKSFRGTNYRINEHARKYNYTHIIPLNVKITSTKPTIAKLYIESTSREFNMGENETINLQIPYVIKSLAMRSWHKLTIELFCIRISKFAVGTDVGNLINLPMLEWRDWPHDDFAKLPNYMFEFYMELRKIIVNGWRLPSDMAKVILSKLSPCDMMYMAYRTDPKLLRKRDIKYTMSDQYYESIMKDTSGHEITNNVVDVSSIMSEYLLEN